MLAMVILFSGFVAYAQTNPFCGIEKTDFVLDHYTNANVTANGNGYDIIRTLYNPISWSNSGGDYDGISEGQYISYSAASSGPYNSKPLIVGLSSTISGNHSDIDFGFYTYDDLADVRLYNGSSASFPVTAIPYTPSTVFRILMDAGAIRFFVDNVLVYTEYTTTSSPLYLRYGMYTYDTEIIKLLVCDVDVNCNSVADSEEEASSACSALAFNPDFQFTSASIGVSTNGTYTGSSCISEYNHWDIVRDNTSGWNAGTCTDTRFRNGGYVEYTAYAGESAVVGFSRFHNTYNEYAQANIDYGIYTDGTDIHILENGVDVTPGTPLTYSRHYRFRIAYQGNRVRYYYDNTLIHTSSPIVVYGQQMIFECSIYDANAAISDVVFYNCMCEEERVVVDPGTSPESALTSNLKAKLEQQILAYPNPFESKINLNFEGTAKIYDSFGKQILAVSQVKEGQQIDLTPFAPGIYYLEATTKGNTRRIRLNKL